MKKITLMIFMVCALQTFAQKLYLHDMVNGNYKSYDVGSKIKLVMKGNTMVLTGKIIGLTKDSIYLDAYPTGIAPTQVMALLYKKNGILKTILLNGAAGVLTFVGGLYTIAALVVLAEDPAVGALGLVFGGGILTSGILIFSYVKKHKNKLQEKTIDQVQYRMFIE